MRPSLPTSRSMETQDGGKGCCPVGHRPVHSSCGVRFPFPGFAHFRSIGPNAAMQRCRVRARSDVRQGADHTAHSAAQGSTTSIPTPSKSRTLRVITAMPRDRAIDAIGQSCDLGVNTVIVLATFPATVSNASDGGWAPPPSLAAAVRKVREAETRFHRADRSSDRYGFPRQSTQAGRA